ncbi:hypothetical protein SHTP_1391 [Mycobacterium ulcerans subsp. shinshuense]|uniref:SnoaL-like domain-containing protein n=1 Tax=Mycobacterium ulcerans subsp. shinshuense TaxID=1124626 RepID=A0A1B4Y0S8_MYCUL|nr:nuclear transport factor 2 family protein [Mycobacterium ulcerans]BAV40657.1 hypothetical protein SHTP_1391 [Mycobacterium ulcerans subsp. shinshuense]
MSIALLREMFEKMVVAKNAELIGHYYDPDFVMYSEGLRQEFAEFSEGHRKIYASAISYAIEYDEDAWVQSPDRVAGRVWITTSRPGEKPTRIEVSHRRIPRRPHPPNLGDNMAELAQCGRARRLLIGPVR